MRTPPAGSMRDYPTTPSGEGLFTSLGGQFILNVGSSDSTHGGSRSHGSRPRYVKRRPLTKKEHGVGAKPGDEARWRKFMAATIGQPPWPALVRAADMFKTPGEALDVGAGPGRDTADRLSRGWGGRAPASPPPPPQPAHPL